MTRRITSGSSFERDIGYARAVVDNDWVFVSGCTGFDYAAMTIADGVEAQCAQALRNLGVALAEAGTDFSDIVRVRYMLPDRADFAPCWPQLRAAFGAAPPAATMIVAGLADPRMRIEIEATARLRGRVDEISRGEARGAFDTVEGDDCEGHAGQVASKP